MKLKKSILAGALAVVLAATAAYAAGLYGGFPATTAQLTGNELWAADTQLSGGQSPQTEAVTSAQIERYVKGYTPQELAPKNFLINGSQEYWQRGTTSGNITTTCLYEADTWCAISGTSTTTTTARQSASVPVGFQYSARVARTASQTGVVKTKYIHIVSTADSIPLQGNRVVFSFWAKVGANFSPTLSKISPLVAYGTSTDDSVANFAAGTWAGYSVTTGTCDGTAANLQVATTSWVRYSCYATIPSTATQVGVAVQWTPVGTAGANDWAELTGLQLEVAPSQATLPSSFEKLTTSLEAARVYRRAYVITESASVVTIRAPCVMSTTSIANCLINFPVLMRATPTMTYTAGFTASASVASTSATVCTALTTTATLSGNAASPERVLVDCASSAGFGAAGTSGFMWDLGTGSSSGIITAVADY